LKLYNEYAKNTHENTQHTENINLKHNPNPKVTMYQIKAN